MRSSGKFVLVVLALLLRAFPGFAHDVPMSYVDVHIGQNAATIEAKVQWTGLRHDIAALGGPDSNAAPTAESITSNRDAITALLTDRLQVDADTIRLKPAIESVELQPDSALVQVQLRYDWKDAKGNFAGPPEEIRLKTDFFPTATNHETLLSIRRGENLETQTVLSQKNSELRHRVGGKQSIGAVVRQFIQEGVHHIFIGPDHILFIIGLLLAGGNLKTLLKIITCFTVAHSITLALATLNILNPPARVIEPVIALSIVAVGVHTLLKKENTPDYRLGFAFGFGLIHGFGFAGVLSELELPRYALGWSLAAFNIGVELGQAAIILVAAPLLALIRGKNAKAANVVVYVGSLVVIFFGTLWFIERLLPQ